MENGFSKWIGLILLVFSFQYSTAQYKVTATALTHDVKDLSQRTSKVVDQNGERCALIKFETPIPAMFAFDLGAQQIEKRENQDDEVWIWVSPDVKKMTIRCSDCTPLKDFRVALKSGNVYRSKIKTGLPQETATKQNVTIQCEHAPFTLSIDGGQAIECTSKSYHTELSIGQHELIMSAPLYKTYSGTFRVQRSNVCNEVVKLEPNYGEVLLNISQPNYIVRVDEVEQKQAKALKMEPGRHKITVIKERYEIYETFVDVELGKQHTVAAVLTPAFAQFTFTTADEETEVWIDGKYRGRIRVNAELLYGEHTIEGRRQGYDTWVCPVNFFDAKTPHMFQIPKMERQYGALRVTVFPPDAVVYFDGKVVNSTDGKFEDKHLPAGLHFIQVRKEDYMPVRDSIMVAARRQTNRDYTLEELALGTVTITTDPEAAIHLRTLDGDQFLQQGTYTGKLPAGDNVIMLKNTEGLTCQYHVIVNEKSWHDFKLPFKRELMIRTNVLGAQVELNGYKNQHLGIKTDKKMKLPPLKYAISVAKKGYETYQDTIDLSNQLANKMVYRVNLRKEGDTIPTLAKPLSPFQTFYNNAGTWYIGIIDFGYTFDLNGGRQSATDTTAKRDFQHWITFGVLPFRYKILGVNAADFEICVSGSGTKPVKSLSYKPTISCILPCNRNFAFTVYGGVLMNIKSKNTHLIGGLSMLFNNTGKFPAQLFGEYKYPISGYDMKTIGQKEQLFRFGIRFSAGIDH